MEKYSNTILYIAEILSQGSLQLQAHGWTTVLTYHPSEMTEYKNQPACPLLEKGHFTHSHALHFLKPSP